MTCFSISSGGPYQELAILSDSIGGWKQHNVSQGGNFTDSPVNRTLMLPAEDFDPLGGHTIWQVKPVLFSHCISFSALVTL